ncbi:uncharacterized protein PHALS_09821 [Plasmopara halstedii]|uniref:Uncharacterized protein n=1 Tax=Plasmopara halstedii TaxID=4781 RepID=A0A0P1AER8_PLAHL|nr:uncharacterized protein PHALS_09821 [Plasmopara halstedii]CEG39581.1 hypothetical protein PHALS_09821 [Plasmopara halstedii]|eukprot:XP_024575950.1 hypothetical protein PHALS_09821 [Plasmopara halstedii]
MLIGIAWNNVQPTSTARRSHSTCYGRPEDRIVCLNLAPLISFPQRSSRV